MPKIDLERAPLAEGTRYPAPHDAQCRARRWLKLSEAAGLGALGVNMVTVAPGAWSSHRHWHAREDEFVYMVAGELVLVEDEGETLLQPGDCAAFPAGVENGHHLQNRSAADATFLVVSNRDDADHGEYSDIDMRFVPPRYSAPGGYRTKDGRPLDPTQT